MKVLKIAKKDFANNKFRGKILRVITPNNIMKLFYDAEVLQLMNGDLFKDAGQCRVTEKTTMQTYYAIVDNVCLMYQTDNLDYIIRVVIKAPTTNWPDKIEDIIKSAYSEQYMMVMGYWSMDWLKMGRKDIDSVYFTGNWNEMVYNSVKTMFDTVKSHTMNFVFNGMF